MSLKAIATALGVSVTTVSRALGGYADVSASTRARVEAEARRRGYRPNTQARRLKTGKTDAVGLVYPGRDVPFNSGVFMDMVSCISRELAHHDIYLLLISDGREWKARCKRGTSHFGKSGWQWEAVMRSEIK